MGANGVQKALRGERRAKARLGKVDEVDRVSIVHKVKRTGSGGESE